MQVTALRVRFPPPPQCDVAGHRDGPNPWIVGSGPSSSGLLRRVVVVRAARTADPLRTMS